MNKELYKKMVESNRRLLLELKKKTKNDKDKIHNEKKYSQQIK